MSADDAPDFQFDLEGRIRNLSLPPSQSNALLPLFEAISNSLHAIEARFGQKQRKEGRIVITVERRSSVDKSPVGFAIFDNGIGLNDENMRSFRTSDSSFKVRRGGKGVGRLSWLKAFENCHIESVFEVEGEKSSRSFTFALGGTNPIKNYIASTNIKSQDVHTTVRLNSFLPTYEQHCPKKTRDHCLKDRWPFFAVSDR